jgi:hypothetical protein
MISYGKTKSEAVRAYREGLPSLLPDGNRWRRIVELHRWGYHGTVPATGCPICELG